MKNVWMTFLCMTLGIAWAWGANSREKLRDARVTYREVVAQHGENSFEAQQARQHLRAARRQYHAERRQQIQKQRDMPR